ncbi:sensor histidine kinase [Leadbetterella sp. DM7]|uniref:sensor histidine kinase n=1 Tax=Leadbetterella sp. DM7 TaxID=3235085 RepID=UPI00349E871A
MRHPILKDKNRVLTYLFLWVMVALFQYIFVYRAFPGHSLRVLAVTLIQNFLLATMYIGAWFGLRYINLETQKTLQFVANHLIYLVVITLLWLSMTNLFDQVLLRDILPDYRIRTGPLKSMLGIFSYLLFVSYMYLDAYYTSYMDKIENERKLYEILKESELNLLKSQMNPHFIFNSLNSISSLTMLDPVRAQEMIIRLSDFLRYTVTATRDQLVTLEKEIDMCRAYLDIEKVRFGSKISFTFAVDPASLPLKVPGMILQTLFENAIKHGVYNSLGKECIHFESRLEKDRLILCIENSFDPASRPKVGTGTGLKNVRNRLDLIYDRAALLSTDMQENRFTATMNLPLQP